MRSLAPVLLALSLQAQPPKLAAPDPRALENIKQFVAEHEKLSCNQVEPPSNSKTITLEFLDPSTPHHGTPSGIDTASLFQNVFPASNLTDFEFDHWATIRGKKLVAYRFSNVVNGKTHAGSVYADENTGAISRIIFRPADQTAHLFCTPQ
jgi:hypothetical protein